VNVKKLFMGFLLLILVQAGDSWAILCDGVAGKYKDLTGTIPGTMTCQGYSGHEVRGLYQTSALAYSACMADPGRLTACSDDYGGTGCSAPVSYTKFGAFVMYHYVGSQMTFHYFFYPKAAAVLNTDYKTCPGDSDGDGLNDDIDPFPTDPAAFNFKIAMKQYDANGVLKCIGVRFEDGTLQFYGTPQAGRDWEYMVGGDWLPSSQFNALFNTVLDNPSTGGVAGSALIPSTYTNQTMATGATDTGNTTSMEQGTDIVNNTKAVVDNQAKQQVALQEIRDGINSTNKILQDGLGKLDPVVIGGGGTGGGATPGEIQASVRAGVDEALTDSNTTAGDFSGTPDGSGYTSEAQLPSGSVPDNSVNTISKTLTDTKSNWSAFTGLFSGSSVTAGGGNCSFNWSYKGQSASFTMCNYIDQLHTMGLVVFSLAGVYACLIVLGRA